MKKQISYRTVSLVFSILILCFAIAFYAIGWEEPVAPPPGGNVPAPLNTGPDGQSKAGGLILNTGGAANGLIVDKGNVGIGDTSPDSGTGGQLKLDVEGPVGATKYCDENGNNCKTITEIGSSSWTALNLASTTAFDINCDYKFTIDNVEYRANVVNSSYIQLIRNSMNATTTMLYFSINSAAKTVAADHQDNYSNNTIYPNKTVTQILVRCGGGGGGGGLPICTIDGQILKYNLALGTWGCANEAAGSIGALGTWTNKNSAGGTLVKNTIYQVTSDGFVLATVLSTDTEEILYGYTDSLNATTLVIVGKTSVSGPNGYGGITMPVKKGDYWRVSHPAAVTVRWLPIGSGVCIAQ